MANYFSKYPKLYYSYNDFSTADLATNILARFSLEKETKDNTVIYYEYDTVEGDTPEIVASKIYGSPERHWVVLMMNDIVDPQYDWPLTTITLNEYIDQKYSANTYANSNTTGAGITFAQTNTYLYYKVITTTYSNGTRESKTYEVDSNTYANVVVSNSTVTLQDNSVITLATSRQTKSYYEYEVEQNEDKRKIKLLKPEFVADLEKEMELVLRT